MTAEIPAPTSWPRRLVKPVIAVVVAALLVAGLGRLLVTLDRDELFASLRAMPLEAIALALALLGAQHVTYAVQEVLAARYAGLADLSHRRTAIASLVSRSLIVRRILCISESL